MIIISIKNPVHALLFHYFVVDPFMLLPAEASKFSLALTAEPISVSGDPKSTLRCITSSPALELFISEALRIISDRSEPKLAPLDGGDPIIKLKEKDKWDLPNKYYG